MNSFEYFFSCQQCPRNCNINRSSGKTAFCGETSEVRIASVCLHFGEEPPITVTGGSGTIFFTGCTLKCEFCQNYQISQNGIGRAVDKDEFFEICLKLQNVGAENINLVTGSHFIPKIADFIENAQKNGINIPFCWNSSSYENVEMLELLKPFVKIWLPDLKTLNSNLSASLFKATDYPDVAKKTILWMIKNFPLKTEKKGEKEKMTQGVIVRHLFLPGRFQETADVLEWLKENADKKAYISLMNQFTPIKNQKKPEMIENRFVSKTEDSDLKDLIDIFDFENLFYQELTQDDSWLPDFTKAQPFSNKLAKPVWHWKNCNGTVSLT